MAVLPQSAPRSHKILVAALRLEEHDHPSFTLEDLALASWRIFPGEFALKGYSAHHPSSHLISTLIQGGHGLRKRGLLREKDGTFTLSAAGRALAYDTAERWHYNLNGEEKGFFPAPVPVNASLDLFLEKALSSQAMHLHLQGLGGDTTFGDALAFWSVAGLSPESRISKAKVVFCHFLTEAEEEMVVRREVILRNGRCVLPRDLGLLEELHRILCKRFVHVIKLLQVRHKGKKHGTQ